MLGFHYYFSCRLNLIFSLRYFIPYSQDQYQHQHQGEYGVSKNNVYYLRYTDVQLPYLFFISFISPLLTSLLLSFLICILIIFSFYFGPCDISYCIIIDSTLLFHTPSSLLCPFLLLFPAPFLLLFPLCVCIHTCPSTSPYSYSTHFYSSTPYHPSSPLLSSSLLTTLLTTLS